MFDADLLEVEVSKGTAKISLSGSLKPVTLKYLDEALQSAIQQHANSVVLQTDDLHSISSEGLRYLLFQKQKAGADFGITFVGAKGQVKEAIEESELSEEITLVEK